MSSQADVPAPLNRRQFSANAVWSLIGEATPFIFAIPAIPLLIYMIGTERFGVLSIIWVAIGYFNLFDLGLSRAVTQFAAERLGTGRREDIPQVLWCGLSIILPLGIAAAIVIAFWAPALAGYIGASEIGQDEIVAALRWLAVGIPFVMAATMFKGLLQAAHAFRTISLIQVPLGAAIFLGPVFVAWLGYPTLEYLTLTLLIARACICIWYAAAALRLFPNIARPAFSGGRLGAMLRYSGWIALSNLISPMMVYFDRLAVGAYLGATAVAYYATPFDVVTRTSIFAVSIAAVVFPTVAHMEKNAHHRVATMMKKVESLVTACVFPLYFGLAAFATLLLELWINAEFAAAGALPAALLCAGMFANSIARIPHAVLQGRGRADLTAIAHLIELPIYLVALFLLLPRFGLAGVAACWAGRVFLDYAILQFLAGRLLQVGFLHSLAGPAATAVLALVIANAGSYPLAIKIAGIFISLVLLAKVAYNYGLTPSKLLPLLHR